MISPQKVCSEFNEEDFTSPVIAIYNHHYTLNLLKLMTMMEVGKTNTTSTNKSREGIATIR